MATPALYRRYRPRRFSELKGQEHIVASLRNAVATGRVGQAYLFSGPRGTGKTSSARILAKVLNCTAPVGGEPCCECDSCLAVERGTSYDVHELDAASNNGVDAMRELIDRTMLGTPGEHKVYILDEVHMLSKGAEAALLKTLEEPPAHVVFVLATTDPQKVSDTIISRTQHLRFSLLPMDVMEEHVRWMIGDAAIDIDEDAIEAVLRQGRGSARDTISALELVATAGGKAPEITSLDEFVEAIIERDPARALTAVAASVNRGRDARTLAEELVGHLRDCFLSLMAPELVTLPDRRATEVVALAQRIGAAATVRAIETIGTTLIEMRHAPDPRVLFEVAIVKLTNPAAETGTAGLLARIERLEQQVAAGVGASHADSRPASGDTRPAPGESRPAAPGRAVAGGDRSSTSADRRPEPGSTGSTGSGASTSGRPGAGGSRTPGGSATSSGGATSSGATPGGSASPGGSGTTSGGGAARPALGGRLAGRANRGDDGPPPGERAPERASSTTPAVASPSGDDQGGRGTDRPTASPAGSNRAPSSPTGSNPAGDGRAAAGSNPAGGSARAGQNPSGQPVSGQPVSGQPTDGPVRGGPAAGAAGSVDAAGVTRAWTDVVLPGLRPLARALFRDGRLDPRDDALTIGFPNEAHRRRCEEYLTDVRAALGNAVGRAIAITLVTDEGPAATGGRAAGSSAGLSGQSGPPEDDEEMIDLSDLRDAPAAGVTTGIDRVTAAFPGAQLIEEDH